MLLLLVALYYYQFLDKDTSDRNFFFQVLEVIVEADDISDEQKARICKKLAEADKVTHFNF
jgi:hypothetical protein